MYQKEKEKKQQENMNIYCITCSKFINNNYIKFNGKMDENIDHYF